MLQQDRQFLENFSILLFHSLFSSEENLFLSQTRHYNPTSNDLQREPRGARPLGGMCGSFFNFSQKNTGAKASCVTELLSQRVSDGRVHMDGYIDSSGFH